MMLDDLFGSPQPGERERLGSSAFVLRGFALPYLDAVLPAIAEIENENNIGFINHFLC